MSLALWRPSLWLPPSLRGFDPLAMFTAGKRQRNSSGKAQRNAAGKIVKNSATSTACCCGGTPCIFCDIQVLKASYAFFSGGGDFPLGMFNGDYWLPFDRVGGPANNQCFFRGICAIDYTGPSTGTHYYAMEVSAPGFFRETVGANAGKFIVPNGNSMSIRMWDDMDVPHSAAGGSVTPALIAGTASCDAHLIFSNFGFSMDLVKDNAGSGAPLCDTDFCVEDSPAACGFAAPP
jgi:hypothetical protein